MKKMFRDRSGKILKNSIIMIDGVLLCILMIPFCILLVFIDMVWMMMDRTVRKLETDK